MATIQTINSWFETGDIPTQEQFQQTFSSFRHKDNLVPILEVEGLDLALQNKLGTNHTADANAHNTVLAKLDASNLNYENTEAWRLALGVGDIPDNVALVDVGEPQEVFNKEQITALYMAMADYVLGGKIRADKIESLGLTELITATETTLATFVANSGNYVFEKNDFIAIAINGNYSLYLFKGGDKSVSTNYLPTGLTNITISMVEGLQAALDGKLNKPSTDGSQFVVKTGNTFSYKKIIPSLNHLLFWDGVEFVESAVYHNPINSKLGIGTQNPSEQLHLTARARMLALVLEDTAETLPQQVTYNNRKFWGTDSTGTKRQFQTADYNAWLESLNAMTPAQSLQLAQLLNGGSGSIGDISVNLISPPIVQNQNNNIEYVLLKGVNLNLNALSSSIEILASDKTTVVATIPNNQIQNYASGTELIFYYNFFNFVEGKYFIRITSGSKTYITSIDLGVVQSVTNIDMTSITWEKLYANGVTPSNSDVTSQGSGTMNIPLLNSSTLDVYGSFKSSPIFQQGDDFYLELKINYSQQGGNSNSEPNPLRVGIGYSNSTNSLQFLSQIYAAYYKGNFNAVTVHNNNIGVIGNADVPYETTMVVIKTGNIFRTIIGNVNHVTSLSNNSDYSLFIQSNFRIVPTTVNVQITKAFKIN